MLFALISVFFSTFLTFYSVSSDLSCSLRSHDGLKEWVDSQPLETITWELNKICHNHQSCYGHSFADIDDLSQQIIPLLTQHNALISFQSSSQTLKHYRTDENGFKQCKFNPLNIVSDPSNVQTVLGSNYFIANDTAKPWFTCAIGQRLNITVLPFKCSSSSSSSSHCNGRGKCLTSPYQSSFQCSCCEKYDGEYCEEIDGCVSNSTICYNGGYCKDGPDISNTLSSFTCQCSEGYMGKNCENVDLGKCRRNECMHDGECIEDSTNERGYKCRCADGFKGQTCEQEINECLSSPCLNGGRCVDGVNRYSCECVKGFSGGSCEVDGRPCRAGVCKNGGTCEQVLNVEGEEKQETVCICGIGFSGYDCSVEGMPCLPNPCQHSSECIVYNNNNFECICNAGYNGELCDIYVNSSNSNCAPNLCKGGGKCEEIVGGYQCRCANGSVSQDCEDAKHSSNGTEEIQTQSNSQPPSSSSSSSSPPYAFIVIGIVIIIVILLFLILLILYLHRRKSPPPYQPYSVSGGIQMNDVNKHKNPSSPEELFQDHDYPDESISYSTSTLSSNLSSDRIRDTENPVVKRGVKKNVVA